MNANFIRRSWPLIALLPLGSHAASSSTQEDTVVVTQSDRTAADADSSYQPHKSVTGTRTEARLLDVPQAVNIVPPQVLRDQAARSLDDAYSAANHLILKGKIFDTLKNHTNENYLIPIAVLM